MRLDTSTAHPPVNAAGQPPRPSQGSGNQTLPVENSSIQMGNTTFLTNPQLYAQLLEATRAGMPLLPPQQQQPASTPREGRQETQNTATSVQPQPQPQQLQLPLPYAIIAAMNAYSAQQSQQAVQNPFLTLPIASNPPTSGGQSTGTSATATSGFPQQANIDYRNTNAGTQHSNSATTSGTPSLLNSNHTSTGVARAVARAPASDHGSSSITEDFASSFPSQLYQVLDSVEEAGMGDILHWNPDGTSFTVSDKQAFMAHISPLHFGYKNYDSFLSQLHYYGFEKVDWGTSFMGQYQHPQFVRGNIEMVMRMKRKHRDRQKKKKK